MPNCPLWIPANHKSPVALEKKPLVSFRAAGILLAPLEWILFMKQITVSSLSHVSVGELIAQSPPRLFFSSFFFFFLHFRFALPREEPLRRFACQGEVDRSHSPSLLTACVRTVETMPAHERTNLGRSGDDHTSFSERGQHDVGRG